MSTESKRAPSVELRRFLGAVDFWRDRLGLSQNAFARRLGISQSYWHQIRTGGRPLTLRVAQLILTDRPDLRHALSDDLFALVKRASARAGAPSKPA